MQRKNKGDGLQLSWALDTVCERVEITTFFQVVKYPGRKALLPSISWPGRPKPPLWQSRCINLFCKKMGGARRPGRNERRRRNLSRKGMPSPGRERASE
jgi:hypothetical protein